LSSRACEGSHCPTFGCPERERHTVRFLASLGMTPVGMLLSKI
jgi:hypothetical protein